MGEVTVTQVTEAPIETGLLDGLIAEATPEAVQGIDWLYPDYANDRGQLTWNLHTYVLEVGGTRIVVDTGVGNHKDLPLQPAWGGWDTDFLERLTAAGHPPEDVDIVVCTHLHLDHVGWNTVREGDAWRPTFPHAVHLFVQDEFDHHSGLRSLGPPGAAEPDAVDEQAARIREQTRLVFEQSVQPLLDAALVTFVPTNHEIAHGIRYVATPGHTPAHHGVLIESGGETGFVTGDFIHHPVQIARPDWSSGVDFDLDQSARTRRAFLDSCADTGMLVLGTHFTGSSAGTVVADGDGFRLVGVAGEEL